MHSSLQGPGCALSTALAAPGLPPLLPGPGLSGFCPPRGSPILTVTLGWGGGLAREHARPPRLFEDRGHSAGDLPAWPVPQFPGLGTLGDATSPTLSSKVPGAAVSWQMPVPHSAHSRHHQSSWLDLSVLAKAWSRQPPAWGEACWPHFQQTVHL